jgi:hypothetical protein
MADLKSRPDYNGAYSGLVKNLWLTIGIAGVCLIGYEMYFPTNPSSSISSMYSRMETMENTHSWPAVESKGTMEFYVYER